MRTALLATALAVGIVSAEDRPLDGKKAFQGTWTIVTMEVVGEKKKEAKEKPVSAPTIVFDGDMYRIKDGDKVVEEGTFEVDPRKTPNTIKVNVTSGPDKGKKWHGIYELEGDTLRAVVGPADKPPPPLLTKPDPGSRAFTLKRTK